MDVGRMVRGDSDPCATMRGTSRPFESACVHCASFREELDNVTKDYEACERENADLLDEVRSMRVTILDLEDELSSTRAGHPR